MGRWKYIMNTLSRFRVASLRDVSPVLAVAFVLVTAVHAAPADDTQTLINDQAAFADRFLDFLSGIEAKYFDRAYELNGRTASETKQFSYDHADYEAKVTRGPVVEKMGRLMTTGKKPVLPFQKPTVFSRHFIIDVHPKSPLVGSLHATIMFQYQADGTSAIASWFDVLSGANRDDDLATLRQATDQVLAKHSVDSGPFRQRLCAGTDSNIHRTRRNSACVGLSFQGQPMMTMTEDNFRLVTEAYDRFLDAYFTIIEHRRDEAYSAAEIAAQDTMRRDYFEYNAFSDLFFSKGYPPFEVWSLIVAPPTVKF